jgi:hypothetical protein
MYIGTYGAHGNGQKPKWKSYAATQKDDATREVSVHFLAKKSEALESYQKDEGVDSKSWQAHQPDICAVIVETSSLASNFNLKGPNENSPYMTHHPRTASLSEGCTLALEAHMRS